MISNKYAFLLYMLEDMSCIIQDTFQAHNIVNHVIFNICICICVKIVSYISWVGGVEEGRRTGEEEASSLIIVFRHELANAISASVVVRNLRVVHACCTRCACITPVGISILHEISLRDVSAPINSRNSGHHDHLRYTLICFRHSHNKSRQLPLIWPQLPRNTRPYLSCSDILAILVPRFTPSGVRKIAAPNLS